MLQFFGTMSVEVNLKTKKLEMTFSRLWTVYKLAFRFDKSKTLWR